MKRNVISRSLIGALIGVAVSCLITVLISLMVGDGIYYPVVPMLENSMQSEMSAVAAQTLASLLYGAVWGGASLVWEMNWSLTKQTLIHLILCSLATFPIGWLMYWIPHDTAGALRYFGIFFIAYLVIWLSIYFSTRKRIREMNEQLRKKADR